MRTFNRVELTNTVGQWVDAFNANALASSDHTWYLGELLFNGMLYTGLETVGGVEIHSLTNLNISSKSPQNIELDNFYLYFRDVNKIVLVDQITFDLSAYNTGHPLFFYINSNLGYRVSSEINQGDNEIMLFRFIISPGGLFTDFYITAQRFGSSAYDTADEYFTTVGCTPEPIGNLGIKLGDGKIKRSGIRFDYHQMPDIFNVVDTQAAYRLRYVTRDNKVDYTAATNTTIISNKILNYATKTILNAEVGKFTIQRILYDIYDNSLIMQYGDATYNSLEDAMTSVHNVTYPFPYDNLIYIPIGFLFVKSGATNLADSTQALFIRNAATTISHSDSVVYAEDSYARGRIKVLNNEIDTLAQIVNSSGGTVASHISNKNNPHGVTKAQVGLGSVDNYSYASIKSKILSDLKATWVQRTGDTMSGNLTMQNGAHLINLDPYIEINGMRLYLGILPNDAPNGSWGIF